MSSTLLHSIQLQSGPQDCPNAKQSQYNFKHLDFLQLHVVLPEGFFILDYCSIIDFVLDSIIVTGVSNYANEGYVFGVYKI